MKMKLKRAKGTILLVILLALTATALAGPISDYRQPHPQIKNVIVMIPDGMSMGGVTLARWYKAYDQSTDTFDTSATLALDEMASGYVRTYWQTPAVLGAITDSAPAGTAFATGQKTNDKHIAVSGDEVQSPYATILEGAKTLGKSTGIIATSNIQHATPAAFTSHYFDRSRYDIITEQQVYQGIDVVFGAGAAYLDPANRKDGENLIEVLKSQGYQYAATKEELENINQGKAWGLFAGSAMAYEMDREQNASQEPSLKEMTKKAIALLSQNEKGFFLMVEGSKVDWAAHANDPIGVISDVMAFDEAVGVALDFAKESQNTMVIAVTDHGNGGITLGDQQTTDSYSKDPLSRFVAPLSKAKLTGEGIEKMLDENRTNIEKVMAEYYGMEDLTQEEIAAIKQATPGTANYIVGPMLSKRANIGWTTGGHTGEDVTLFTYLPGNERIWGMIENTDIANAAAAIWGIDLEEVTQSLYINGNEAFAQLGAQVVLDKTDSENPVLVVTKEDKTLIAPESKNYVLLEGEKVELSSIIVQTNDVFYLPQEALELMQ